jgi:folate-binding protein YgfZ
MIIHAMKTTLNGVTPLTHLGVIKVEGAEAAKFLHGQLTQDFELLGLTEARLAAFCSAKGRMQASFYGFKRSPVEILLICNRDVLAPTLKRLSMFVMRAKAKLTDASDEFALFGVAGDATNLLAAQARPVWSRDDLGLKNSLTLYPADGVPRLLVVAPVSEPAPEGPPLSAEDWAWGEVRSGVVLISAPVVEAFVPQMLNYESVGGVNFKKGCYPGQEVVARSQFRGTLKRRAYLVHAEVAMSAGMDIFQALDPEQPCGTVVQAAPSPQGGFDAVVSMQVSAFETGGLHLGAATGPALSAAAPPYPLLADI